MGEESDSYSCGLLGGTAVRVAGGAGAGGVGIGVGSVTAAASASTPISAIVAVVIVSVTAIAATSADALADEPRYGLEVGALSCEMTGPITPVTVHGKGEKAMLANSILEATTMSLSVRRKVE